MVWAPSLGLTLCLQTKFGFEMCGIFDSTVCIYICIHIHINIYIHIYTCMYTYSAVHPIFPEEAALKAGSPFGAYAELML